MNQFNLNYHSVNRHFISALLAIIILSPVSFANKYIFDQYNVVFLTFGVLLASILISKGKVNFKHFYGITITFLCFFLYALVRFNWENDSYGMTKSIILAETELKNIIYFFLSFYGSAIAYASRGYLSGIIWYLVFFYLFAYIVNNSLDIEALYQGYSSSPGFVIISLLPLLFMKLRSNIPLWIICTLSFLILFWLSLIGSRTTVMAITIFLIVFWIWPFISRTKTRYIITFLGMLFGIFCFNILYLKFAAYDNSTEATYSFYEIFNKSIGTRIELWKHLAVLIKENLWFGHGTEQITSFVAPVYGLDFSFNRENLSAHSIYYEVLYRIGIVGLFLFLLIIYKIWMRLWIARETKEVRIVGSYIIALLFFITFSKFLVLSTLPLYSLFSWIIIGIGVGSSLKQKRYINSLK